MDTLLVALMMVTTPVRPNMNRDSRMVNLEPLKPVIVSVASTPTPARQTTCYTVKNDSCWSE